MKDATYVITNTIALDPFISSKGIILEADNTACTSNCCNINKVIKNVQRMQISKRDTTRLYGSRVRYFSQD